MEYFEESLSNSPGNVKGCQELSGNVKGCQELSGNVRGVRNYLESSRNVRDFQELNWDPMGIVKEQLRLPGTDRYSKVCQEIGTERTDRN